MPRGQPAHAAWVHAFLVGVVLRSPTRAQDVDLTPLMDGPVGYLTNATFEATPAVHSPPCGSGSSNGGRETVYFLDLQPGWG